MLLRNAAAIRSSVLSSSLLQIVNKANFLIGPLTPRCCKLQTMSCVLRAVLLATTLMLCEAIELSTVVTEGKDFVDVLKHKLRKNNDDYEEPLFDNTTTPSNGNLTKEDVTFKGPSTIQTVQVSDARRSYKVSNKSLHNDTSQRNSTNSTVNEPNFRSKHKIGNKEKMEKFKKFMSKSKTLLRDIMNKKRADENNNSHKSAQQTSTTRATTTTQAPKTLGDKHPKAGNSMPKGSNMPIKDLLQKLAEKHPRASDKQETLRPKATTPALNKLVATRRRTTAKMRKHKLEEILRKISNRQDETSSDDSSDTASGAAAQPHLRAGFPSDREALNVPSEELDMAPAKGRKIHVMRLKGRLCDRSVMLPEGPKYDSRGVTYLGPYFNKYGRDYSQTRRPRVVLPRCCNCCKKSVLGCQ